MVNCSTQQLQTIVSRIALITHFHINNDGIPEVEYI